MIKDSASAIRKMEKIDPSVFNLVALRDQVDYYNMVAEDDKHFSLKRRTIEYKITVLYIGLLKGLKIQYYTDLEEGCPEDEALYKLKKDIDIVTEIIGAVEGNKEISKKVISKIF